MASVIADQPSSAISRVPTLPPTIDTTVQAINNEPVELDSTPVSPEMPHKSSGGPDSATTTQTFSPDFDDEALREINGEKGQGEQEREKRAALLSKRSKDPAVLVDIPQTPGAEELAIADATTTDAPPTGFDVVKQ